MKITKQRLKEIIKEELEFVGAEIDNVPEPPEEEPTRDRAFDSPEGRLVTLMNAREKLNQMTTDQLKDLSMSLDAPMFATLLHILGPMYAPMEESDEMELEEYRGEPERRSTYPGEPEQKRQAPRPDSSTHGKKPAPRPSSDTRTSNSGYRSGATGKKGQGRGGW